MKHGTHKALLTPALLLFLVASAPAAADPEAAAERTIVVTFEAHAAGTPGTWKFSPSTISLEPGHRHPVRYELDPDSSVGWGFQRIAISEENPTPTDFIGTESAPAEMEYEGLLVRIEEFTDNSILVGFEGILNHKMTLGIELTVGNGDEQQTSRDPQIVLERDPEP